MSEQSQEQQNQYLDNVDGAMLMVECYSDGELGFSCDWQDDDTGISCMATILVYLGDKDLPSIILQNLESIIQSDDKLEQLEKLKSFYGALKKVTEQNKKMSSDDVVVPPLEASTLM